MRVTGEHFREKRDSWKLDLELPDGSQIELFSFPNSPQRISRPEALRLRHLAFSVEDIEKTIEYLHGRGVEVEPMRIDEYSNKKFTFFFDPDKLPLEIYEQ